MSWQLAHCEMDDDSTCFRSPIRLSNLYGTLLFDLRDPDFRSNFLSEGHFF